MGLFEVQQYDRLVRSVGLRRDWMLALAVEAQAAGVCVSTSCTTCGATAFRRALAHFAARAATVPEPIVAEGPRGLKELRAFFQQPAVSAVLAQQAEALLDHRAGRDALPLVRSLRP